MTDDVDPRIARAVSELIQRRMDEMLMVAMDCASQSSNMPTAENTMTHLKLGAMLEECDKIIRNTRRASITVVVDLAHEGPILQHETPNDGSRVEMSWRQANELHQHWPLELHKVNSPEQAEFVPASGFGFDWGLKHLPIPPYDMPPDDDFALPPPPKDEGK